jgi:hypothetical protein
MGDSKGVPRTDATLPSDPPPPRQRAKRQNPGADQGLLWDHHFDGHAIAAIVRVVVVIPVADPIKLV